MKVRWTPEAERDRLDIWRFIAEDNPNAAERMDQIFGKAAAGLRDLPHRGRVGAVPGTRELIPHESYRLVYEIDDDTVWVVAIAHTARPWPFANN